MAPIRIGCVKYLNTLPLIEGLRSWRDADLTTAVPSRLIDLLLTSQVDVALCSVIDAARHADRVRLLTAGMIGCDGPTLTVRLFSRVPIGSIRTVGVDTDSHTSAVLMQVILSRRYHVHPRIVDFDARERMVTGGGGPDPDALLLIGDKVVTDPPSITDYPHQLDLGEEWKRLTGLPFVYAAWMCRAGEDTSLNVRTAADMLDRQRRHNATRLGWIVNTRSAERHWPTDTAAEYVGHLLKYGLDAPERESIDKFIAWAHELNLCPSASVTWAEATTEPVQSV